MRKRIVALRLCLALLVLVAGCSYQVEPDLTEAAVAVDPSVEYQEIDGFGGALAFYENWVTAAPKKKRSTSCSSKIWALIFYACGMFMSTLAVIPCSMAWSFAKQPKGIIPRSRSCSLMVATGAFKTRRSNERGTPEKRGEFLPCTPSMPNTGWTLAAYDKRRKVVPDYISIQNEPDYVTDGWETCRFDPKGEFGLSRVRESPKAKWPICWRRSTPTRGRCLSARSARASPTIRCRPMPGRWTFPRFTPLPITCTTGAARITPTVTFRAYGQSPVPTRRCASGRRSSTGQTHSTPPG